MAEVFDNLASSLVSTYIPFTGIPEFQSLPQAALPGWPPYPLPRGQLTITLDDTAISAKPLNDTQVVQFGADLPQNFAWLYTGLSGRISQDRAHDWGTYQLLRFARAIPNGPDVSQDYVIDLRDTWVVGGTPINVFAQRMGQVGYQRWPIWSVNENAPSWVVSLNNQTTTAAAAGTINFAITFLQLDLNEAQNAAYNAIWPRLAS